MPLILPKNGYCEMEEKKSRFIGHCAAVYTEPEARSFISDIRKQHPNANHNVFAYSTIEGNIIRFNDDGEPSGTAGMPVLNVYEKSGIINYVCVVTRYFGGTLLGAGGLVRAYSKAAKGAMENSEPEELVIITDYLIKCSYSNLDRVKYSLNKQGIAQIWEYTDICQGSVSVREDQEDEFQKAEFYEILHLSTN